LSGQFDNNDSREQIRQAIDVVELVNSYVQLKRQGRQYVGLCPWHEDSKPSLTVNQERQTWICWVCDLGGDIFSFIQQHEGVGFREALEMLAERAGIEIGRGKPVQPGSPDDKQTLLKAAAWAEQQYIEYLHNGATATPAREYLERRRISSDSIARHKVGYCPDDWTWLLNRAAKTPFTPAVLEAAGLAARSPKSGRYYDTFRGRVMFPIHDTQRRTIAFGGRVLPSIVEAYQGDRPPAKYINTAETRLFSKHEQLYALDIARDVLHKSKDNSITVVEGYTDVVMAHQHGVENVVAVLGTALGEKHIRILKRFAESVVLVLDGDEAGQRRTNEILELFVAADVDLRILTLPAGLDPCDYVEQYGAEAFGELTRTAADALEHRIRVATAGVDLVNDTHRANQALEAILATISQAPRLHVGAAATSPLREQQVIARLARMFAIDEESIRRRISDLRKRRQYSPSRAAAAPQQAPVAPLTLSPVERELVSLLCSYPHLTSEVLTQVDPNALSTTGQRLLTVYRNLQESGEPVEFSRVLIEIEPRLKALLVSIDQEALEKNETALDDPQVRLADVLKLLEKNEFDKHKRATIAGLQSQSHDEQGALDILKSLIDQERNRHGINGPTEG